MSDHYLTAARGEDGVTYVQIDGADWWAIQHHYDELPYRVESPEHAETVDLRLCHDLDISDVLEHYA